MAIATRISAKIKFSIERMLGGGALLQLLLAWGIVVLVAITGGLLAFYLSRGEADLSEEFWWSFLRLTDPGYLGDDQGLLRRVISTLLTVAGYVLFMGTLVAIMTQWLFRQMRHFELGQTPVNFRNHTVLLGWNSRTLPVLNELINPIIPEQYVNKIAILAEDITQGPSEELHGEPLSRRDRRRIVLRSGSILNPEHLERVAIADARTVIIPSRSNSAEQTLSADTDVIKVLLSLQTEHASGKAPRVVAELQDARKVPIALHTYQGDLQVIASDLIIARILKRSTLYPGLSGAVNALLIDPEQAQFMPESADAFVGKQWKQVFAGAQKATPCGILRAQPGKRAGTTETILAPSGEFTIEAGDEILYLASSHADAQEHNRPSTHRPMQVSERLVTPVRALKRRVLILGWNNRVTTLLDEMAKDDRTKYYVTNVSSATVEERQQLFNERWPGNTKQLEIHWQQADYTAESVMMALKPQDFDSVMLFSSDRLGSGEEADARSIVAFMLLDYLLAQGKHATRPHIMVELHDPSNAAYVNHSNNEVLVSSVVVSHVLAQVAVYPQLRVVYEQLLSADGARMALRFLPEKLQRTISVAELREYAFAERSVLLGYQEAGDKAVLNPSVKTQIKASAKTQLIVLQGV
ncbi:hypothetical protein CWE08_08140 [Aliidiomarina iranensis]|uniref:RCK N-terminal domain-containing protein n=1 Tax=Aliidiomarina iranensis TaxID=1434071 RepID=A0A432VV60_9GAMM|nr:hypothetical protein [Aliidiomarina iranensis]RUO20426.1 hypothetical protein CWE08_08140 [Aliidiomarina iranensis]